MLDLVRHPDSHAGPVRRVSAQARRTSEGRLALEYAIEGDMTQLVIPAPGRARIGYKLWRHTCCEVFFAPPGAASYHEFNFSPSGEWTAYGFSAYRQGATLADDGLNPQVAARHSSERLEVSALVDLQRLSVSGPLSVGLAVIVERTDGGFSYWAIKHPPGRPDFHHRDGFALELA